VTARPDYLSLFHPVPSNVSNALETLDGRAEAPLPADGLLLQTRRNRATGRVGLLVCESWVSLDPSNATVLAELLGAPGGSWEDQTAYMDRLTVLARKDALALVAHGMGEHVVTFVVSAFENRDGHITFSYLARLLNTDGELAQWRER
jgi:hypothetical protein